MGTKARDGKDGKDGKGGKDPNDPGDFGIEKVQKQREFERESQTRRKKHPEPPRKRGNDRKKSPREK